MNRLQGFANGGPVRRFVVAVVRRYADRGCGHWASAIGLNLILTYFPIVLVALFAVGSILQDQASRDAALRAIAQTLPGGESGDAYAQVATALDAVRNSTQATGILGILGLIWAGSGLFGTVEAALGSIYGFPQRSFVRGKLMAIAFVLLVAVGLVASVAASSALTLIRRLSSAPRDRIPIGDANLALGELAIVGIAGLVVGLVIFRVVPRPHPRWPAVWPGAVVFGLGFLLLTLMFPLYMSLSGLETRFGQTFGLLLVLVIYASLQGQVLVVAACVNATVEDRLIEAAAAAAGVEVAPGSRRGVGAPSGHPPG